MGRPTPRWSVGTHVPAVSIAGLLVESVSICVWVGPPLFASVVLITAVIPIPSVTRFTSPAPAGQVVLFPQTLLPPEARPALQSFAAPLPNWFPATMLLLKVAVPASQNAPPPLPLALLSWSAWFNGSVL
jgi:hypothetical protein